MISNKTMLIKKMFIFLLVVFMLSLCISPFATKNVLAEDEESNPLENHEWYESTPTTKNANELIKSYQRINRVTGANGLTDTSVWGLGCTDLGIPYTYKDELHVLFGDSFSGSTPGVGTWKSNVLAKTKDFKFSDGLTLDSVLVDSSNMMREIIPSLKSDHQEKTTIPTGAVVIDDVIYVYYMSIRMWGNHGEWHVNYGGVYKSTDGGNTFEEAPYMWHHSNIFRSFTQIYPLLVDDTVYLFGLPGGRNGGLRCARVNANQIEDMSKYRYFDGYDSDGIAQWIAYDEDYMAFWNSNQDAEVIPPACGEMNIVYNAYLNQYIATYANGDALVARVADNPWGPYSDPYTILKGEDYISFYNGFTCEAMQEDNGKSIYFLMSQWPQGEGVEEDYFVSMFKLTFK